MKALILLHSSTGNTRVVTRYAAQALKDRGYDCTIHNIAKDPTLPALDDVDLLGVAYPVMYFRPTLTMEAVLRKLRPPTGLPAFVLATAAGDPGPALLMTRKILERRGCRLLDGHWVLAPSNWPVHISLPRILSRLPLMGRLYRASIPLGKQVWTRLPWRWVRPTMGLLWLDACTPAQRDRDALDDFLQGVVRRHQAVRAGQQPEPTDLEAKSIALFHAFGENFSPEQYIPMLNFRSDSRRCNRCNRCVDVCPEKIVVPDVTGNPTFGKGCTGCYACFNSCDQGAISAWMSPRGMGRYKGPPRAMRELFR